MNTYGGYYSTPPKGMVRAQSLQQILDADCAYYCGSQGDAIGCQLVWIAPCPCDSCWDPSVAPSQAQRLAAKDRGGETLMHMRVTSVVIEASEA